MNISVADGTVEIPLEELKKCIMMEPLIQRRSFNVILSGYNDCCW
jgi:hypothetical protein